MKKSLTCPGADELRRFLLGEVSEPVIEETERHLVRCPKCLQTVLGLEATDTLTEAVKAQAEAAGRSADPRTESLIRRLEQLSDPTLHPSPDADTPSGAGPDDGDPHLSEEWAAPGGLLRPAQGPDEIGRLGAYRIRGVLGRGGMGVVFRAEDTRLDRTVALKVLRPGLADSARARQRFLREVRAAAAVEHDHVVHINEVGEDRGIPFVAMPLLQGETLEQRLRREGRLPVAEVLRVGREMAEGLAAAHDRGLIHRDVKPANVWLEGPRGKVKLLDFGLARPAADSDPVTRTGFLVGTPAFMAPEQAEGGRSTPAPTCSASAACSTGPARGGCRSGGRPCYRSSTPWPRRNPPPRLS